MGFFDNVFGSFKRSVEQQASNTISDGVHKGVEKIKERRALEKCPHCKKPLNAESVKFCQECGKNLMISCKKCNVDFKMGTKFCNQCGEKLI